MERVDNRNQTVSGDDRIVVEGDAAARVLGDDTTVVGGASTLEASEVVIRAGQRLSIEVGPHRVLLDESGLTVELGGGTISLTGADQLEVHASKAVTMAGGALVTISGGLIRLN